MIIQCSVWTLLLVITVWGDVEIYKHFLRMSSWRHCVLGYFLRVLRSALLGFQAIWTTSIHLLSCLTTASGTHSSPTPVYKGSVYGRLVSHLPLCDVVDENVPQNALDTTMLAVSTCQSRQKGFPSHWYPKLDPMPLLIHHVMQHFLLSIFR